MLHDEKLKVIAGQKGAGIKTVSLDKGRRFYISSSVSRKILPGVNNLLGNLILCIQ